MITWIRIVNLQRIIMGLGAMGRLSQKVYKQNRPCLPHDPIGLSQLWNKSLQSWGELVLICDYNELRHFDTKVYKKSPACLILNQSGLLPLEHKGFRAEPCSPHPRSKWTKLLLNIRFLNLNKFLTFLKIQRQFYDFSRILKLKNNSQFSRLLDTLQLCKIQL